MKSVIKTVMVSELKDELQSVAPAHAPALCLDRQSL